MISLKEFIAEGLSPQGRYKKQRAIKKYRYKLNQKRKIAAKINASKKRFSRRLSKSAVRQIYKSLRLKGKNKMSSTQKAAAERLVKQRAKYLKKAYVRKETPKAKRTYR